MSISLIVNVVLFFPSSQVTKQTFRLQEVLGLYTIYIEMAFC